MGYNRSEIEESLANAKYDDVFATYLLLGRKSSDVSTNYTCVCFFFLASCSELSSKKEMWGLLVLTNEVNIHNFGNPLYKWHWTCW